MKRNTKRALYLAPVLLLALGALSYGPFARMMDFKKPRYETGARFKGAQSCEACHKEIYDQWKSSFSAQSTSDPFVRIVQDRQPFIPNRLMLGEPCYSCHGPKALSEGISCEVCHGINDREDVMEVHREKYSVNLQEIRKSEYCGSCHEAVHPLTTDPIITTMEEWRNSQAARKGIGCVDCHMRKDGGKRVSHGGGSRRVDASVYKDAVAVRNLSFDYPRLSLDIENKITGHYLPTGGPEPALLMQVSLKDRGGSVVQSFAVAFQRKSAPVMAFPGRTISDNRLRDGETRTLSFEVPASLKRRPASAVVALKFLDIDFVDLGDVKKQRWQSPAFYERTFPL
jgi:hypothetical protein